MYAIDYSNGHLALRNILERKHMLGKAHWDQVWQSKPAEQTSRFQTAPVLSGDFITRADTEKSDLIIDIDSGASCLVDWIILARYSNITALDIAAGGILKTKKSLGPAGDSFKIIEADIRTWSVREPLCSGMIGRLFIF